MKNQGDDEYHVVVFDIRCTYENSEIDEDLLTQLFTDNGLVYGEIKLPGEQYPSRYIFGNTAAFDNDPENYLENNKGYLNYEYSSGGYNRPCDHQYEQNVYSLGTPTDSDSENAAVFQSIVNKNSKNLDVY